MATGTTVPPTNLSADVLGNGAWALELSIGRGSDDWSESRRDAALALARHLGELGSNFVTIPPEECGFFSHISLNSQVTISRAWELTTTTSCRKSVPLAVHTQLRSTAAEILAFTRNEKHATDEANWLLWRLWELFKALTGRVPACV